MATNPLQAMIQGILAGETQVGKKASISELPAAETMNDTDVIPVVQDGQTKKVLFEVLKKLLGGSGISEELTDALKIYFTNVQTLLTQLAYTTENNIGNIVVQNAKDIVSILAGEEAEEPDETITLTSISVTYTGGDVAVGTVLTDLTGITVTATYSDGSTTNVTGYTLSGTIAEGENTITVSYSGKTTTFTVTGVAESSGDDSGSEDLGTPVYTVDINTTSSLSGNILSGTGITVTDGEIITSGADAKLQIINGVPTLADKTIVVEFGDCARQGTAHGRLLLWNTGSEGIIYRSTGYWGIYADSAWIMTENADPNIISNNSIKLYINETLDHVKVTVGDELLVEADVTISTDNQIMMFSGSQAYYNAVVKSINMYEGDV